MEVGRAVRQQVLAGVAALMLCAAAPPRMAGAAGPHAQAPGACNVYAVFLTLAGLDLWPGYEPAKIPLAVYDGERTWLFGYPQDLVGFSADGRCPHARSAPGQHADVRANTSIQLGGVAVATLLAPRASACTPDSASLLAAVAIHEAFHAYQRQHHPRWQANEGALFAYPVDDERVAMTVGEEVAALRHAVAAPNAGESAGWARTALAARTQRAAILAPELRQYEIANEWNEGLAQYLQDRSLELARQARMGSRARVLEEGRNWHADGPRRRGYATGEAWAVLLERHAPGWRERLNAADSLALPDLVAGAIPDVQPAHFSAAESERVRTEAQHAARNALALRAAHAQAFDAAPGHMLVFEAAGEPLWPQGFDPFNVESLGGGRVLHARWIAMQNRAARIEVLDHASATESAGAHPLFNGVRRLVVTGLSAAPTIAGPDSATTVRAPGVDATVRGAHIERSATRTVVRIGG